MSLGYIIFLTIGYLIVYLGKLFSETLFSKTEKIFKKPTNNVNSFIDLKVSKCFYTNDFLNYFYSKNKENIKIKEVTLSDSILIIKNNFYIKN